MSASPLISHKGICGLDQGSTCVSPSHHTGKWWAGQRIGRRAGIASSETFLGPLPYNDMWLSEHLWLCPVWLSGFFFPLGTGDELRAWHMLSKYCATELHPYPSDSFVLEESLMRVYGEGQEAFLICSSKGKGHVHIVLQSIGQACCQLGGPPFLLPLCLSLFLPRASKIASSFCPQKRLSESEQDISHIFHKASLAPRIKFH